MKVSRLARQHAQPAMQSGRATASDVQAPRCLTPPPTIRPMMIWAKAGMK